MKGKLNGYIGPIIVGVLVLIIVGIGSKFLERGTTITVLERQVAALEKAVVVFENGFRKIDREHRGIDLNELRISNLEDLHRDGLR